jgi:hypothetical protein
LKNASLTINLEPNPEPKLNIKSDPEKIIMDPNTVDHRSYSSLTSGEISAGLVRLLSEV